MNIIVILAHPHVYLWKCNKSSKIKPNEIWKMLSIPKFWMRKKTTQKKKKKKKRQKNENEIPTQRFEMHLLRLIYGCRSLCVHCSLFIERSASFKNISIILIFLFSLLSKWRHLCVMLWLHLLVVIIHSVNQLHHIWIRSFAVYSFNICKITIKLNKMQFSA